MCQHLQKWAKLVSQEFSLEVLFSAFVAECQSILGGLRDDGGPLRLFVRPSERVRWLAERAERTSQFAEFVAALPVPPDSGLADFLTASVDDDWGRWFLRNVGLYHDLVNAESLSLARLLDRWAGQRWGSRRLYLLSGMALDEPGVIIGEVRIHRLDEEGLEGFFNNRARQAFDTPVDLGSVRGGVFLDIHVPMVILEDFYMGPDRSYPWLAYLNLVSTIPVSIAAMFERPAFDSWALGHLSDPPQLGNDGVPAMGGTLHSSRQLQQSVEQFEGNRKAALSSRVEIALKSFTRGCRALSGVCDENLLPPNWDDQPESLELAKDRDGLEWGIIDLCTAMEAIYLDDSRSNLTSRFASRAASLLSISDEDRLELQSHIKDAYDTRSRLVHGDSPLTYRHLHDTAAFLRKCTRRSLVALLHLKGNQRPIIAGVEDEAIRTVNRLLVPA